MREQDDWARLGLSLIRAQVLLALGHGCSKHINPDALATLKTAAVQPIRAEAATKQCKAAVPRRLVPRRC